MIYQHCMFQSRQSYTVETYRSHEVVAIYPTGLGVQIPQTVIDQRTMGNIPVVAEVATCFQSLGDVMTGNPDAASQRWRDYSESSVIGSGVRAAIAAGQGNMEEA